MCRVMYRITVTGVGREARGQRQPRVVLRRRLHLAVVGEQCHVGERLGASVSRWYVRSDDRRASGLLHHRPRAPLPLARGERANRHFLAHHQQRLRRVVHVEEASILRPCVQLITGDKKRHRPVVADRLVQPHAEHVPQGGEQPPQPGDGKAAPP